MSLNKDPYEILGVSRQATPEEIKKAYRRLAKQYHPDRNPNDKTAEQRFKEVHAAYEVLGDPQRRAQYDRFGAGGPAPDVHTWTTGTRVPFEDIAFDFGSLGDLTGIFEQFFRTPNRGGARPRRRAESRRAAPRGADIEHEIELSFEEAARGTTRDVVLASADAGRPHETIRFRVPPGVADGQRIRLREQGQPGPGGRGDLMIRCRVRPHPLFRREGADLLLDLPLTFGEAALGAEVEIPTLEGPTVVKVPPGTSSGTKLRLRGRGLPGERKGDLYAVVRIMVPKAVSPRARELITELESELRLRPREHLGGRS
ncbi:MAG: DnaJ C-terminal domain-containing protein [Planctomycetota bacterium]